MTREEIAAHFGVDVRTIYRRRRQFVQFYQALDRGRRVCRNLFGDPSGPRRLMQIDSTIARLPGLEWFNLASSYCLEAAPNPVANYPNRLAKPAR